MDFAKLPAGAAVQLKQTYLSKVWKLSKPNSTQLKLVWPDYGLEPTTHHHKLLDHFQTTQEADFRHATLF